MLLASTVLLCGSSQSAICFRRTNCTQSFSCVVYALRRPALDFKRIDQADALAFVRQPYRSGFNGATDLRAAANMVVRGQGRSIARSMNIPESTLRGAVKNGVSERMGRPPLLLAHEEARLYQAIVDRANSNLTMTKHVAGVIASEILRLRDVGFATDDGLPSDGWWRGFLTRHSDISFRSGSRLKAAYFCAFSVDTVNGFFDIWKRLMTTYNFLPKCTSTAMSRKFLRAQARSCWRPCSTDAFVLSTLTSTLTLPSCPSSTQLAKPFRVLFLCSRAKLQAKRWLAIVSLMPQ